MGRSVNYLNNAERVNYFQWPVLWVYDEDTDTDVETDEYWDAREVIEDIQETIISNFPEFDRCNRWDGREVHVILEGYGVEIGLSEYCGLASLSVRVLECYDLDDQDAYDKALKWIDDNWDDASKYWNRYQKIGTFSNGESIYETK